MPKIVIREYDKTTSGVSSYANFSVVVPGFVKAGERPSGDTSKHYYYGKYDDGTSIFDENGIYECSDKSEFIKYVGLVPMGERFTSSSNSSDDSSSSTDNTTTDTTGGIDQVVGEDDDDIATQADEEEDPGYDAYQMGNQIAYELLGLGYTILYKKIDSTATKRASVILSEDDYWECLKDKSVYDFRYVITGLIDGNEGANIAITDLATFKNDDEDSGRGDCIALLDVPMSAYITNGSAVNQLTAVDNIIESVNSLNIQSKYAAFFAPVVTYNMADKLVSAYGNNKTFPASFHYLACAAKAAENFNEWYAVAGYTRGISKYTIDTVGCKFGEAAIAALEPRNNKAGKPELAAAVNLIIKIKTNHYLWGNRTAEGIRAENSENGDLVASHFLNIRQLCTTIKKQVYIACRRYTFSPNSDLLWINFCAAIRPTLEDMKNDQGIKDYVFIKEKSDKKALLSAKIRIVPIEAVEDFDISIYLEDSISGVNVTADETETA